MMSENEPTSLHEIQQKMQEVRGNFEENVDEFRQSTQKLVDWKTYVSDFPLASAGVAAVVGYLLVPSKKKIVSPDADEIVKLAKRNKLVVEMNPSPAQQRGMGGAIFGFASSLLFRGLTTYLGSQLGKMTNADSNPQAEDLPPAPLVNDPSSSQ